MQRWTYWVITAKILWAGTGSEEDVVRTTTVGALPNRLNFTLALSETGSQDRIAPKISYQVCKAAREGTGYTLPSMYFLAL